MIFQLVIVHIHMYICTYVRLNSVITLEIADIDKGE